MATPTRHFPTSPSHLALFRKIAPDLSPRQRDALAELAAGRPLTLAASAAGVHRATLHHWLTHDPEFQAAHAALARHRAESASGLAALTRAALEALLTDPALAPELRLRAIQLALTAVHTLPAPELLESLEAQASKPEATPIAEGTAAWASKPEATPVAEGTAAALVESSPAWAPKPQATPLARAAAARNAPCPCGSKLKFKRCCGKSSPPMLFPAAPGHSTSTGS